MFVTSDYRPDIKPTGSTDFHCNAGKHIEQTETGFVCVPCPPGMFNPHNNHTYISCFKCTTPIDDEKEVELKACTLTSDTEIGCREGYFRKVMGLHEASCNRCSNCKGKLILSKCSRFKDTWCITFDLQ
ncbi:tumor necrosis factor receptor superfamily member 1A [Biomphalaria glabrata]